MKEGVTREQVETILGELDEFTDHPWGVRIRPTVAIYYQALVLLSRLYDTDNIRLDTGDPGDETALAEAGAITIYRAA